MSNTAAGESDPTMQAFRPRSAIASWRPTRSAASRGNAEHHPLILPVNYGLDGTSVVIRTRPGMPQRAAEHANVTFEVDDMARRTRARRTATNSSPAHTRPVSSRGHRASTAGGCG
jgi:hypothetical protein